MTAKTGQQKAEQWESLLAPIVGDLAQTGRLPSDWMSLWGRPDRPMFNRNAVDSSINHDATAAACGLFHPDSRDAAIVSWQEYQVIMTACGCWETATRTRIYGHMTLSAAALAYRWASLNGHPLKGFLNDFLRLHWTLERLGMFDTSGGPRSLVCGARSEGTPGVILRDVGLGFSGLSTVPWRWVHGDGAYYQNDPWAQALIALQPELQETAAAVAAASSAEEAARSCPRFVHQVEQHFYRTLQGLAVWCQAPAPGEDGVPNNNTGGMAAMGIDFNSGTPWTLGIEGRVREQEMLESCWLDGNTLRYHERIGGPGGTERDDNHWMPAGSLLSWVVVKRDGSIEIRTSGSAEVVAPPTAGAQAAPAPPVPGPAPATEPPLSGRSFLEKLRADAAKLLILFLVLLGGAQAARAADATKGLPYYSVGTCADQHGVVGACATLDIVRYPSLFRPGHVVVLSGLVSQSSKGAVLSTDLWTQSIGGHDSVYFVGIGAVETPAAPGKRGKLAAVLVFSLRVKAAGGKP